MDSLLKDSLTRITTAIKPQKQVIKDFVTEKTFLHGRPFTTVGHEYQELLMEELVDPDIEFVLHKVAQAGASEVIYRILLAFSATIPSYSAALVLPSLEHTREVMKTRIASIIDESPTLKTLKDSKVDSSSLKRFMNGSVIYGLSGSGTSKSTTISRPLRTIVADELQYISMKTLSGMASRQRHQLHKSTIYFSSPRYSNSDIDAEIQLCGHIWQALLKCVRCNHEFIPSFYDHVRVPGFDDPIETLNMRKMDSLNLKLEDSYLECPKCKRNIPHGPPFTNWINASENPNLPKRGMKIGPFDLPNYVTPANLVQDMVRMTDNRSEFDCQFLAIPISSSKHSLDKTQIRFENHDPGALNVFGLDVGKMSYLTIGSLKGGRLYIHHIELLPLKSLREDLPTILKQFRCIAGVIDLMPYSEITSHFVNTIPNTWAAVYQNTLAAAKKLELFALNIKDDEALGTIRLVNINMTPTFDYFADQLLNGLITYKSSPMDKAVGDQLSVMSRQRDYSRGTVGDGSEIIFRWRKPSGKNIIEDHLHHSSIYCTVAAKLISKSRYQTHLPMTTTIRKFRLPQGV